MSFSVNRGATIQPVVTFIGIITFGIIIAVYVNTNVSYRLPIILVSFLVGFVIAGLEIRTIVRQLNNTEIEQDMPRDEKLARYVAELFDEDIPFDELSSDSNKDENMN